MTQVGTKWARMPVSRRSFIAPLGFRAGQQLTLNQWVPGSSPGGCTKQNGVSRRKGPWTMALLIAPNPTVAGSLTLGWRDLLWYRIKSESTPKIGPGGNPL